MFLLKTIFKDTEVKKENCGKVPALGVVIILEMKEETGLNNG